MTKDEALKLALEALERSVATCFDQRSHDEVMGRPEHFVNKAIDAIKKALAQPEQKYHRGDRLICLETEEYCVIHILGTDRQWVKFPDSHIGVYTNKQFAELFELLPKEPEQELWRGSSFILILENQNLLHNQSRSLWRGLGNCFHLN